MKLYLLSALLLPLPLYAQQAKFKALQADINLAGIGLKTTFLPGPKTELDAGVGYGLSMISTINSLQYQNPVPDSRAPDAWGPEIYHGAYIKAGMLYKFATRQAAKPASGYLKLQYTGWLKGKNVLHSDEANVGYQNRLALKVGYRKALNTRQTRSINFEAGVGLWANYNLNFFGAGPQLNINFINDLFSRR